MRELRSLSSSITLEHFFFYAHACRFSTVNANFVVSTPHKKMFSQSLRFRNEVLDMQFSVSRERKRFIILCRCQMSFELFANLRKSRVDRCKCTRTFRENGPLSQLGSGISHKSPQIVYKLQQTCNTRQRD
jgi:hypothetical protein